MEKINFKHYLLLVAAIALLVLDVLLYIRWKSSDNFVKFISPVIEERDTTSSLLNYEILRDSVDKCYKQWEDGEWNR